MCRLGNSHITRMANQRLSSYTFVCKPCRSCQVLCQYLPSMNHTMGFLSKDRRNMCHNLMGKWYICLRLSPYMFLMGIVYIRISSSQRMKSYCIRVYRWNLLNLEQNRFCTNYKLLRFGMENSESMWHNSEDMTCTFYSSNQSRDQRGKFHID